MKTKLSLRERAGFPGSLLLAATLLLPCFAATTLHAQKSVGGWSQIYEGVWYATGSNSSPLQRVYALRVDTENPWVKFKATPGNGGAQGQTTRQTTPSFRSAHGLHVAINANYYQVTGSGANIEGLLISDGNLVSGGASYGHRPAQLRITSDNLASLVDSTGTPSGIHTAIAGSGFPLLGGSTLGENSEYHPRTGLGLSQNGRYVIMVVIDGRQPGYSNGATTRQLGQWLKDFGAWNGMMLDGGGSSTLVAQGSVKNSPSDGSPRSVGANFGVKSAALGLTSNHLDVYARTGSSVYYKRRLAGPGWSGWNFLGGSLTGNPAAGSYEEGRILVVARGSNGNVMRRRYSNGAWAAWDTLGAPPGGFQGSPSIASRRHEHYIVVVRGNDNALWRRSFLGYNGTNWNSWSRIDSTAGLVASSPTVVSRREGELSIFYRGTDGALKRMRWTDDNPSTWLGPTDHGGSLDNNPAAISSNQNEIFVYSLAWDGNLWRRGLVNGSWTSWEPIGTGGIVSGPAVASMGATSGRHDVFFRAPNNSIRQIYRVSGSWNGPNNHGGSWLGGPGAVSWNK